jgi:hypothetical protein
MGDLTAAGVYETTACDAGLVLSELISNALRHATPLPGSVVKVAWQLGDGCLELAVSDGGGPTVPMAGKPAANALGGRGLGIVDRLSLRWGVFTGQDGGETTVWAALPLTTESDSGSQSAAQHRPHGHNGATSNGPTCNDTASRPGLVIASSRDA